MSFFRVKKDSFPFNFPFSRRQFVLAGGSLALASLIPFRAWPQAKSSRRLPVLQSWAERDLARVTVVGGAGLTFQMREGTGQLFEVLSSELPGTGRWIYHLNFRGLSTSLFSQFEIRDASGLVIDHRQVKGLDVSLAQPNIALMSCASDRHLKEQEKIWARVPETLPDIIFFNGDTVYANSRWQSVTRAAERPERALQRYVETWEAVDLYALDPLIPVLANWDDHDYGMNNGDATHPWRAEMQNIFRTFYPVPDSPLVSKGPGVSFRAHLFGRDFHFLDNRSFFEPDKTRWGQLQEAWFEDDFTSRSHPAWILSGVCFMKHSRVIDSVQKTAPQSFANLQRTLRAKGKPFLLCSGDIHASQV
jgi:hypothetical protein